MCSASHSPTCARTPSGASTSRIPPGYENKITVHVIAKVGSVDELHKILEGWPEAMREEGNQGTHWLGQRLLAAGVAVGPTGDPISDN